MVHQKCPNILKATSFSPGKRAFGTDALCCAMFDVMCYDAAVEEAGEDQDLNDTEDFVALSIKSLERFAILDGGATKTVCGFTSVQPIVDQYEDTTIETSDVGFTFAGGEKEAASTNIWIPHAVNFVSNESTPLLIGLDVILEYGLVIDYHHNRVYNHIMKRYFPCAIFLTWHLSLEMMPSKSE